jgi:hypothetical protein
MDPPSSPLLRRAKPFHFGSIQDSTSTPSATKPRKLRRLLRVDFKNPKDDYIFIQELRSNLSALVCHRKNRLHLAVIRESFSPTPLQMLDVLAQVQHPNIADVLDVYFHDDKLYIVGEHLHVSLLDLGFNRLAPEEWEVATIIAEVILLWSYVLENRLKATGHQSNGLPLGHFADL